MNIKKTIVRIVFYIFAAITFIGFLILASAVDIGDGMIPTYLLAVASWACCGVVTVVLYDNRYLIRHVFATCNTLSLIYGCIRKIHSRSYQFLYDIANQCDSFIEFYMCMLYIYDVNHERKRQH